MCPQAGAKAVDSGRHSRCRVAAGSTLRPRPQSCGALVRQDHRASRTAAGEDLSRGRPSRRSLRSLLRTRSECVARLRQNTLRPHPEEHARTSRACVSKDGRGRGPRRAMPVGMARRPWMSLSAIGHARSKPMCESVMSQCVAHGCPTAPDPGIHGVPNVIHGARAMPPAMTCAILKKPAAVLRDAGAEAPAPQDEVGVRGPAAAATNSASS